MKIPRTGTYVFISPVSCDLIFGLDVKAIWGLDDCQVKDQYLIQVVSLPLSEPVPVTFPCIRQNYGSLP